MIKYYIFLAIAIASELCGTTALKYTHEFTKLLPSLLCIACYGVSFYMLAKCLENINLSVAYATWSAVGLVVTSLISVFIFSEKLTLLGVVGLILIIVGVVLMNMFGMAK